MSSKVRADVRYIGKDVPDEIAFPLMFKRMKGKCKIEDPAGCWNWTGFRGWNGYGQTLFRGKAYRINRLMYMITKGPIPAAHVVMHSCDNRMCLNPDHLSVGTQKQNIRDAIKRRGGHVAQLLKEKTHCVRGHAFAETARFVPNKGGWVQRACTVCQRMHHRRRAGWPEWALDLPSGAPRPESSESQRDSRG